MKTNKKYEFTGETMQFEGHTLKRIRFLREFDAKLAKKGKEGGWIEHEGNLSHDGDCYVAGEAKVFGNAQVMENGVVSDLSVVKDNVQIKGNSKITRFGIISGDTIVDGEVTMIGHPVITFFSNPLDEETGKPNIYGNTMIWGDTVIEATGYIDSCNIHDKQLSGHLELKNQNIRGEKEFTGY